MDAEARQRTFRANSGRSSVRRMFGGQGVFVDGLMIALVSDGVIYLKAERDDSGLRARRACAVQLRDQERRAHAHVLLAHAGRLYDDTEELARWARAAQLAARARSRERSRADRVLAVTDRRAIHDGSVSDGRQCSRPTVRVRTRASNESASCAPASRMGWAMKSQSQAINRDRGTRPASVSKTPSGPR